MWWLEWRQCRFELTAWLGVWGEEKGGFEEDWPAWEARSVVVFVTKTGPRWRGGTGEGGFWWGHLL